MLTTVLLSLLTLSVIHGAAAGESWLPKDFKLSNVVINVLGNKERHII